MYNPLSNFSPHALVHQRRASGRVSFGRELVGVFPRRGRSSLNSALDLIARTMSPVTSNRPFMNARWGLSFPELTSAKVSSDISRVASTFFCFNIYKYFEFILVFIFFFLTLVSLNLISK